MIPAHSPFRPGGQYFGPLMGVVTVALVAGLAWFFLFDDQVPEPEPELIAEAPQPAPAPAPSPAREETPGIEIPPLNASDSLVRELVSTLTSHPAFTAWLIPDNLIRLFVVVVENVADGQNPAVHMAPLKPTQRFVVAGDAPELTFDPASYARYNTHAEIVASINPAGAAELYRMLYPLITEAYADLGYPDGGFDNTLQRALTNLLDTPVLERNVTLVPRAVFFEFSETALEDLLPAQKQFMGMGPRNVRAVQASLLDIARELGIDPRSLPTPAVIR